MLLEVLDLVVQDLHLVCILVWPLSFVMGGVPFLLFFGPILSYKYM